MTSEEWSAVLKEDQYFTPEVEDLHVGYECEIFIKGMLNWQKHKFKEKELFQKTTWFDEEKIHYGKAEFRTEYLTKEQIEAEGWKSTKVQYAALSFDKNNWILWYDLKSKILHIEKGTRPLWVHTYYRGECKSINELRYICKLLKIN